MAQDIYHNLIRIKSAVRISRYAKEILRGEQGHLQYLAVGSRSSPEPTRNKKRYGYHNPSF